MQGLGLHVLRLGFLHFLGLFSLFSLLPLICRSLRRLGQKYSMDVGQYTSLGDSYILEKFVQLIIIANSE